MENFSSNLKSTSLVKLFNPKCPLHLPLTVEFTMKTFYYNYEHRTLESVLYLASKTVKLSSRILLLKCTHILILRIYCSFVLLH